MDGGGGVIIVSLCIRCSLDPLLRHRVFSERMISQHGFIAVEKKEKNDSNEDERRVMTVGKKTYLNPFLNLLDTSLRYLIRPVPVVFLRLAFWPHSYDLSLAEGYPHCAQATERTEPVNPLSCYAKKG